MAGVEVERRLNATLYIHCKDSVRKEVVSSTAEFKNLVRSSIIDPKHKGHGAEVIANFMVKDASEIMSIAFTLYNKVNGIMAIQPTIEIPVAILF